MHQEQPGRRGPQQVGRYTHAGRAPSAEALRRGKFVICHLDKKQVTSVYDRSGTCINSSGRVTAFTGLESPRVRTGA
jgi:hypothetical protein